MDDEHIQAEIETPEDRAARLTEKLRGLLKDELAKYGGGEAFMRWVRSDPDDDGPIVINIDHRRKRNAFSF